MKILMIPFATKPCLWAPFAVLAFSTLSAHGAPVVSPSLAVSSYGDLAFDANDAGLSYTPSVTEGDLQAGFDNFAALSNGVPPAINPGSGTGAGILFPNGTDPASFTLDLEAATDIGSITLFSSHTTTRSFLLMDVYGSNTAGLKPGDAGSTLITNVSVGTLDQDNDVVAAQIADDGGASLGSYRYLIFDLQFSNGGAGPEHAFITEIDVTAASAGTDDPTLTDFSYVAGDGSAVVSIKGAAGTRYKLVEADDLDFTNPDRDPIPLSGATVGTLEGNEVIADGSGNATVQFKLGTAKDATFLRAVTVPVLVP